MRDVVVRYVEVRGDRVEIRESARDHVVRGALALFVAPWIVAGLGWGLFALFAERGATSALVITGSGVALGAALGGLYGLVTIARASRRAERSRVVVDLGERLVERVGRAPEVYRRPSRVSVARAGLLGWSLRLEGEVPAVLVRRVPHGSGRALAEAADVLAEALGVEARVPSAARGALGLVPHDEDRWAALAYAPLDGVNAAYALLALLTSRHARLRFAAKQSLVLLAVEGFLALALGTCLAIPLAVASAPAALEAAAFLCPFVILALVRVVVRMVAAWRANRREVWVMPWLAPVVRRWVPPPPPPPPQRKTSRNDPWSK
ncbi:MAG: hypothetical protein KF729_24680 [Sandaracinaceae bacterium]|nr:hypothetical protein [Sandaracinaceae bacterium]